MSFRASGASRGIAIVPTDGPVAGSGRMQQQQDAEVAEGNCTQMDAGTATAFSLWAHQGTLGHRDSGATIAVLRWRRPASTVEVNGFTAKNAKT